MPENPKSQIQPDAPASLAAEHKTDPSRDRSWIGYLVLALLFAASMWLIRKADDTKPKDWNESRLTYLPSGKMLKPMVMDLDEAVADLLWIKAMLYFSDAYMTGKSYQWLGHILDIVTILNPRLHIAYEFGGVVLTKEKKNLPKTLKLLDRGISEFPEDWRLRLFAATARVAMDSNFTAAAEYLKPITLNKEVPDHIRTLCATFLSKGGGQRVALAFLVDRYLRSDNAINREIFVDKILKLYPGPPEKEKERKDAVTRVLKEVGYEPTIEMMGLGIIHEYLSNTLSPDSKRLMEALYQ
ncbi:MAG: hypothetical protein M3Y08_21040 [Fibrobacterota bacterium]|nr:hypothetical protein [Fibrobacterota bacterium]